MFSLPKLKYSMAVCPICTLAVGSGFQLARIFGVDDLITGIWLGGLVASLSFWFSQWMAKKKFLRPFFREFFSFFTFLLSTIPFLIINKRASVLENKFLGIDKIIFGTILGLVTFTFGVITDKLIRKLNHQKPLFYYQKVIVPVLFISVISLFLFFII
ncbi:MAG: hypothetical protein NZL96_01755 [Patescibacteria group bacterium]|nr:hypothetical protein [Patescibacteria group bacterium]